MSPVGRTLRPGWAALADQPFVEPWQARAFALAVLTCERLDLPWEAFRQELKAAVAAEPDRPYYESWTAALEQVLAEHVLVELRPARGADASGGHGAPRPG